MTQLDNSVVPKWNEEPSTLDAFEERVILYVLGTKKEERYLCGPRLLAQMDPERQPYKVVKSAVTTTQLAAEGLFAYFLSCVMAFARDVLVHC